MQKDNKWGFCHAGFCLNLYVLQYCSYQQTEGRFEEMKLFKMYLDDTVCTVRGDKDEFSKFAISLHKNMQFTLEKVNMEGDLAFLDSNVNVSSKSDITCRWFQKPTDKRIILSLCSSAQLQHLKNVIQGTVQRVFSATSRVFSAWLSIRLLKKKQNLLDQ